MMPYVKFRWYLYVRTYVCMYVLVHTYVCMYTVCRNYVGTVYCTYVCSTCTVVCSTVQYSTV